MLSRKLFVPILAGATLRDRLIACAGALLGIGLTAVVCGLVAGGGARDLLIVAPMGASAVLLFAVPASPLAQPWSLVGGNVLSAIVGLAVAHTIAPPALAAGLGVALAILAMSLARCLHPPGGAAALTAVLGGPTVDAWGWMFPFVPVGLNSVLLLAIGLAAHRLTGHAYPHRAAPGPTPPVRVGVREEDVDAALRAMHETFDVSREDLMTLVQQIELQAARRIAAERAPSASAPTRGQGRR